MFDSSYPFQYKRYSNLPEENHPYQRHVYTFKGKLGHTYHVHIEEYEYELFALKFHLEDDTFFTEHKYEQLTHLYEVAPVLRTCLNIMLHIQKERPLASFGFTGAPLPGQTRQKYNTKRYRVYRKVIANFFSPVRFSHFVNEKQSAYLLLNRDMEERTEDFIMKVEALFVDLHSLH